jgi:hypothetical protein
MPDQRPRESGSIFPVILSGAFNHQIGQEGPELRFPEFFLNLVCRKSDGQGQVYNEKTHFRSKFDQKWV